jgi:hypothetical protein
MARRFAGNVRGPSPRTLTRLRAAIVVVRAHRRFASLHALVRPALKRLCSLKLRPFVGEEYGR